MNSFLEFFISATGSWIFTFLLLPVLTKKVLDVPNERSSHTVSTPRGGGIGFVIIGTAINFFTSYGFSRWIPIACIPLALVGFIDDVRTVSPAWRYLVQLITASLIVLMIRPSVTLLFFVFLVLLLTAIINFFNFMDGLDGLVAGCGILLFIGTSSWSLAGSIFGFLLWNWNPARVFMGDAGSTFIGAVFGGLLMRAPSFYELVILGLAAFPILADSFTCLLRRMYFRQRIFQPHREHLYQRLQRAGWSHRKVSSLYIFGVGLILLAKTLGHDKGVILIALVELLIGLYLDRRVAFPFQAGKI